MYEKNKEIKEIRKRKSIKIKVHTNEEFYTSTLLQTKNSEVRSVQKNLQKQIGTKVQVRHKLLTASSVVQSAPDF